MCTRVCYFSKEWLAFLCCFCICVRTCVRVLFPGLKNVLTTVLHFFFINLCVDRQGNSLLAYCVLHVVCCLLFFSFFSRIRDNYFGALANTGFGHVCE